AQCLPSPSKSMTVARRGCARAGAAATFITIGSSISRCPPYPARDLGGRRASGPAMGGATRLGKYLFYRKIPGFTYLQRNIRLVRSKLPRESTSRAPIDHRGPEWKTVVLQGCSSGRLLPRSRYSQRRASRQLNRRLSVTRAKLKTGCASARPFHCLNACPHSTESRST